MVWCWTGVGIGDGDGVVVCEVERRASRSKDNDNPSGRLKFGSGVVRRARVQEKDGQGGYIQGQRGHAKSPSLQGNGTE